MSRSLRRPCAGAEDFARRPEARFNFVMGHVIERAPGARATCRGCGIKLGKGELRFGERAPNPFGEGEVCYWFHLECAAYLRPEPLLQALAAAPEPDPSAPWTELRAIAEVGALHRRLPRLMRAERATSGRASCRCCREPIAKGSWRLSLALFEDGRMQPIGFIHVACAEPYFEAGDLLSRIVARTGELTAEHQAELERELGRPAAAPRPVVKAAPPEVKLSKTDGEPAPAHRPARKLDAG